VRLRYIAQVSAGPPTFVLFVNRPAGLTLSYLRYLGNSLREVFDLDGVPLRFKLRRGKNPYA
jgi:GTPase